MTKVQVQAVVDYINGNAAKLHGVDKKALDVGGDITAENIVSGPREDGLNVVLVVDRGGKGSPKYVIPAADVEAWAEQQKLSTKVKEAVTKKAA